MSKIAKIDHPLEGENQLTLYFIASPFGIDWTNPKTLFTSIAKNYFSFKPHFMGHVHVHFSGTKSNGEKINIFTGMRGKKMNSFQEIFFYQKGLAVVFNKFQGHLENELDLPKMANRLNLITDDRKQKSNFISFKINTSSLERLERYYQLFKEFDLSRYYGLHCRPLHGEGAGCSAFGVSFLEVIGINFPNIVGQWSYKLQIPKSLCGPPIQDQKVSFLKLIKNGNSWGEAKESEELFFWEPDKMHQWVNEMVEKKNQIPDYQIASIGQCHGIIYNFKDNPTKTGPIFSSHSKKFFEELDQLNQNLPTC